MGMPVLGFAAKAGKGDAGNLSALIDELADAIWGHSSVPKSCIGPSVLPIQESVHLGYSKSPKSVQRAQRVL